MGAILWGLLLGLGFWAVSALIGLMLRADRQSAVSNSPQSPVETTSLRVQYWAVMIAFVAAPVLACLIVVSFTSVHVWGIALLLTAVFWLVLGLVTVAIPKARGVAAYQVFVASVERQSRASFKSVALYWLLAIVAAILFGVLRLTTTRY